MDIRIEHVPVSRVSSVDFSNIVFGTEFSDHMFIAEFDGEQWTNLRIQPFGPLPLSPALSCMHYGQAVFEGLKAYRTPDHEIQIFRPADNARRLNESARIMCMAEVPEEIFIKGIETLCSIDAAWIPDLPDTALYLRPFLIASDIALGVRPSTRYMFIIYACTVGAYYTKPLRVKVETHHVRACRGGVGEAKAAGNYAAAMFATVQAQKEGFNQLLWTDAIEHKFLEELGTSNFFLVSGNTVITPETNGTVLKGITRDSIMKLARHRGFEVEERPVTVQELFDRYDAGTLDEMFVTGTAATITPIHELYSNGRTILLQNKVHSVADVLKHHLEQIKRSHSGDLFNWNHVIRTRVTGVV